jgi:hypothetical protein
MNLISSTLLTRFSHFSFYGPNSFPLCLLSFLRSSELYPAVSLESFISAVFSLISLIIT